MLETMGRVGRKSFFFFTVLTASVRPCVRPLTFSNDFSSEAAEPI